MRKDAYAGGMRSELASLHHDYHDGRRKGVPMTFIFIKHSPTFWEVRPLTKAGMRALLDYILMLKEK